MSEESLKAKAIGKGGGWRSRAAERTTNLQCQRERGGGLRNKRRRCHVGRNFPAQFLANDDGMEYSRRNEDLVAENSPAP